MVAKCDMTLSLVNLWISARSRILAKSETVNTSIATFSQHPKREPSPFRSAWQSENPPDFVLVLALPDSPACPECFMWHAGKKHLHSKKGTFPKIGEAKKKSDWKWKHTISKMFLGGDSINQVHPFTFVQATVTQRSPRCFKAWKIGRSRVGMVFCLVLEPQIWKILVELERVGQSKNSCFASFWGEIFFERFQISFR